MVLSTAGFKRPGSWETLRALFEAPYREGFRIETPNVKLDRAVPFNRFLIDLGFNGYLHVCELFRWRDVWSRDLGSGLAPGAMVDGQFAAARTTIDYDLHRHAIANPRGLKVTEDASQGGSAEGVAWLTRAVWRYYLLMGDREFLANAATTLRPWVNAWVDRDADDRGLLIDVTEWMDHSRFLLFPDGARVLYSNVLFADLLRRFAAIERTLGDAAAAQRLDDVHLRFVRGIRLSIDHHVAMFRPRRHSSPALITTETRGEQREITPQTASRTFVPDSALSSPPDRQSDRATLSNQAPRELPNGNNVSHCDI